MFFSYKIENELISYIINMMERVTDNWWEVVLLYLNISLLLLIGISDHNTYFSLSVSLSFSYLVFKRPSAPPSSLILIGDIQELISNKSGLASTIPVQ